MNYYQMRKIQFNFSTKTTPFRHQLEAVEFMKGHKNVPLFDEQGLGKSKVVIDTLCQDIKNNLINSALIVCKKFLLHTWKKEISKHSYLQTTILGGTKNQRGRSFMHSSHFYLINYESFIQELERIKMFLKLRRFAVVLDESQKIKNPISKITQSILEIGNLAVKKIIITGTPIANKPEDLWSQFYFLDNGRLLGSNSREFRNKFRIKLKGERTLRKYEPNLSLLKEKIDGVAIRRTKDILELPEKVYRDIFVEIRGRQKQMYEKLKRELLLEIAEIDGQYFIEKIDNYLVKLLRLTQIASNPAMLDENYTEIPAKFMILDGLIKNIMNKQEKVIIWSSFRKNIRILRRRYEDYGALMLFGDIPIKDRDETVDKFTSNAENRVLVANPSAAKEGLTLTTANNAIYLDRTFNMDDYLQSQDRIHRISQKHKCNIIKLIAIGTIDEYIDDILEKKHAIARYTLGDVKHIETNKQFLTNEEVMEILG